MNAEALLRFKQKVFEVAAFRFCGIGILTKILLESQRLVIIRFPAPYDLIGKLVEDEKVQGVVKEVMDKAKDIDPKDIDPKDIKGTIEKIVKD